MENRQPLQKIEESSSVNLPLEAKKLLEILDELQDFTNNLRKKLIAEIRPDSQPEQDESKANKVN